MNITEYISSGILEAYVLGELTNSERLEVEANLRRYPELKQELALVEKTAEELMMKVAVTPAAGLRDRVLQNLQPGRKEGIIIPLQQDRASIARWQYATAASVAMAITAGIFATVFWDNWKQAEFSLNELIAQNRQIAQDYNTVNQRLDKIESDLKVYDNPNFRKVVMKGTAGAPEALASIYWNENTREVFLSVQNLKTLSQEQQYQLWAIVDGKPVDMGVFDGQVTGLLKMKDVGKAAAFAVTVEPRGGKPAPTLETMQVLGNT